VEFLDTKSWALGCVNPKCAVSVEMEMGSYFCFPDPIPDIAERAIGFSRHSLLLKASGERYQLLSLTDNFPSDIAG
jgi:hypothetical protein